MFVQTSLFAKYLSHARDCAGLFVSVTSILVITACSTSVSPDTTPAATLPPLGLGIDRQTLMELFDDDFGFTPPSTTEDGTPIVNGESSYGQEGIGLMGPPDNLTKVYIVAVPDFVDANEQGFQNVRRAMLLMVVVPEWEDASQWMTTRFHTLRPGDSESVEIEGKRITMDPHAYPV